MNECTPPQCKVLKMLFEIVEVTTPHCGFCDVKGCGAEPTDVQCGTSRNTHGLANAFFRSHSQAQKALAMDKADMEGRYIELSMDQVLGLFFNSTVFLTYFPD